MFRYYNIDSTSHWSSFKNLLRLQIIINFLEYTEGNLVLKQILNNIIHHQIKLHEFILDDQFKIDTLPNELWQLTSLQVLNISGCCMVEAPLSPNIAQLGQLKHLNLTNNFLSELPNEMMEILDQLDSVCLFESTANSTTTLSVKLLMSLFRLLNDPLQKAIIKSCRQILPIEVPLPSVKDACFLELRLILKMHFSNIFDAL